MFDCATSEDCFYKTGQWFCEPSSDFVCGRFYPGSSTFSRAAYCYQGTCSYCRAFPGDVVDVGPGKCLRRDVIDCPSKHCELDRDAEPDGSDGQPCGMAYRDRGSKFIGGKPKFARVAYRLDGTCSYCQKWRGSESVQNPIVFARAR